MSVDDNDYFTTTTTTDVNTEDAVMMIYVW
jgi:hypothetical protein